MGFLTKKQFERQNFIHYLRTGEYYYYGNYLKWFERQNKNIETKSSKFQECQWIGGDWTCNKNEGKTFKIGTAPIPMHPNCRCVCVPVACARITSPYKLRYHPKTGTLEGHSGVDIGAPAGTPIKSPIAGTVTNDPSKYSRSYGYWVQVQLEDGSIAEFGHLQSPSHLKKGDTVNVGDMIGNVGATGENVTGNHLHYTRRPGLKQPHMKPPQKEVEKLLEDLNEECSKR